jgi:hypothetical protein
MGLQWIAHGDFLQEYSNDSSDEQTLPLFKEYFNFGSKVFMVLT